MILDKILKYKKEELESLKRRHSLKDVEKEAADQKPARDFMGACRGGSRTARTRIIAEIKKASPSAGVIREDFDPLRLASTYEENGAAALSVLTDEHFFQGSLEHLKKIRKAMGLPLLRKDFVFDEYQIFEARAAGADAVLLIVRILEKAQLKDYQAMAMELGMAALIEVHDEKEMGIALDLNSPLVGINNRDLDTLKVDLETTEKLMNFVGAAPVPAPTFISESGISSRANIERLQKVGVHAFLVGEILLREKNVGYKLKELLGQTSPRPSP